MKDVKKIISLFSLTVFLASTSLYADSSSASEEKVEKSALTLLKNSYNYLGSLQKYAFKATVVNRDHEGNEIVERKHTAKAKVLRPSQFRVDSKSDIFNRSVYLSNGVFTMMDNKEKYYARVETGTDIDETLEYINKRLGIVLPLSTLLHSDMGKFFKPKKVKYFGTRTVTGVECNYVAFRKGSTTVHLWIENSDTPLVRVAKIITDDKQGRGTTDLVLKWNVKPHFSNSVFVFKAPKGSSNVSIRPVN
jgi:hypothetical protein